MVDNSVRRRALDALRTKMSRSRPLAARPPASRVPLTSEQQWLSDVAAAVRELTVTVAIDLPAGVDPQRMWTAVQRVVERHDATRFTVAGPANDRWLEPSPPLVDWRDGSDETGSALMDPGDPVVRARWLPGPTLELSVNQVMMDRQGAVLLAAEVIRAYSGYVAEPTLDFTDYCCWAAARPAAPQAVADAVANLGDLSPSHGSRLPISVPLPGQSAVGVIDCSLAAPGDEPALVGAVVGMLHRFGAGELVRLGVCHDGRTEPAAREMIGQLSLSTAGVFRVTGEDTLDDLTAVARKGLAAARTEPVPLHRLLDELDPGALSDDPLLPVGVRVLQVPELTVEQQPVRLRLLPSDVAFHAIELTFLVGRDVRVLCEYDRAAVSEPVVTRMVDALDRIAGASPHSPLVAIDLGIEPTQVVPLRSIPPAPPRPVPVAALPGLGRGSVVAVDGGALGAALAALEAGADVLVVPADDPAAWRDRLMDAVRPNAVVESESSVRVLHDGPTPVPDRDSGALLVVPDPAAPPLRIPISALRRAAVELAAQWELTADDTVLVRSSPASEDAVVTLLAAAQANSGTVIVQPGATDEEIFDLIADQEVTVADVRGLDVPVHLLPLRFRIDDDGPRRWWVAPAPESMLVGSDGLRTPTADVRVHVLDADGCRLPVASRGEVWVGVDTETVCHRAPRATADRFRPDPYGPPGSRMTAAGAVATLRSDGALDIVHTDICRQAGRTVAVDAVRAVLAQDPDLLAYVGIHQRLPEQVYAVVTSRSGDPVDVAAVRARLTEQLPKAAVPQRILPVARTGLPSPAVCAKLAEGDADVAGRPYDPPQSDVERRIIDDVLIPLAEITRIGRHDSVFDWGGSSLHVVRAVTRVEAMFDVSLPMAKAFLQPTAATLAELVVQARDAIAELLAEVEADA